MGMTINVTVKSNDPERVQEAISSVVQQVTGKSPQVNIVNVNRATVDKGSK